ncbi:MAG: uncharacterized protein PWQ37_1341 [Candidatus Petromonas sp.]|nr:uncharacterized protein [Candidatus Petromonas sp.]
MLTTEQKLLAVASHLGWLIGFPVLIPIVIMLLSKDAFVKEQSKEALSFQLGVIVAGMIFGALSFILIGIPFLIITALSGIIFPFVATIKVLNGSKYSYPITGKYIADKL